MSSRRTTDLSRLLARGVIEGVRPLVDSRIAASRRPYSQWDVIRPRNRSRLWSATHYGVFIPSLPEPFRYLNTMTFIGSTGTEAFDNDYLVTHTPQRLATVLSSTAHTDMHHYRGYDTVEECSFTDHRLKWGEDLDIEINRPTVRVHGDYDTFTVRLELTVTDQASYFVKTPIYDHVSLLAEFTGEISHDGSTTPVEGLGTFEYARFLTPQSLWSRQLPDRLKLPVDLFTYQIIDLGDAQLLLTDVQARGSTACALAHIRSRDGATTVLEDVTYDVITYAPEPLTDPIGRVMRVPLASRWTIRDDYGIEVIRLECHNDAPFRYGHGRGYVTAYSYTGDYYGTPVEGSGYMEWVDTRRSAQARPVEHPAHIP